MFNMGKLLEVYYSPGMSVSPPPEIFMTADWFLPVLRRMEAFIGGFVQEFDTAGINDWYRPFQEQKGLYERGKSTAAVSEHCFAAALDLDIPDEFRDRYAIDFFAKVIKIDRQVRIGWLDYQKLNYRKPDQKPVKSFTFFHAGFGWMIPFDVRRKFIDTYFAGKQAEEIWFRVNQSWKQEMKW
jgi:hypothetical protein